MRRVAILGSTGSIGTQTLDVIGQHPDLFQVELLTANNNKELLAEQAIKYNANTVVIGNEEHYEYLSERLSPHMIKVFVGSDSITDILEHSSNIDIVVAAMVGFSGLKPTLAAIRSGKTVALANKETLVAAGAVVTSEARKSGSFILPIDSEHSAIFQSLQGERSDIEKILLTASGGPFLNSTIEEMEGATREIALRHPRWNMGAKVTIDSASMMNKGLEMIEAKWLFDVSPSKIQMVIHPQSIIHSMVQFSDGSIIGQMGVPDMRIPIQYALSYPYRLDLNVSRLDLFEIGRFDFFKPDVDKFPCIRIAYEAIEKGGNIPCLMNAANEVAVDAFLNGYIKFTEIPTIIERSINRCIKGGDFLSSPNIDDIFRTDEIGRIFAKEEVKNI